MKIRDRELLIPSFKVKTLQNDAIAYCGLSIECSYLLLMAIKVFKIQGHDDSVSTTFSIKTETFEIIF